MMGITSRPWAYIYYPLDLWAPSSYDKPNHEGQCGRHVDLLIRPKAPKGLESNWIPTQGKRPLPVMPLYGGDDAFWDKSFKMPDVELVDCSFQQHPQAELGVWNSGS
jgi:hypothetical protein